MMWELLSLILDDDGGKLIVEDEGTVRRYLVTLEQETDVPQPDRWEFPVIPPAAWYCASVHDLTGVKNNGYKHSGIDLNLDRPPWGDVDQGQLVYAVHGGYIYRTNYHKNYLGCVIVKGEHEGAPLYTRYWHLGKGGSVTRWLEGDNIMAGQTIGRIGNYKLGRGGDHLHFDMALDPFEPTWWHTRHPNVRWVDPVPILKAHLTPSEVDLMIGRDDG